MSPAGDDRVRMHEAEPVIGKDPERSHALGARAERRRDLARGRVGVALRGEPIAHEHPAESGRAGHLVVTERVVAREVLRVPLRRDRDAFVRAHRGRADRGAQIVVHAQHLHSVVRERRGRGARCRARRRARRRSPRRGGARRRGGRGRSARGRRTRHSRERRRGRPEDHRIVCRKATGDGESDRERGDEHEWKEREGGPDASHGATLRIL